MRRSICAAACLVLFGVPAVAAETVTVYIAPMWFSTTLPGNPVVHPTINPGDSIRWLNLQGFHTTTSVSTIPPELGWDSGMMAPNDEFVHTFTTPGTYWYYCIPHGQDNGDGTASGHAGFVTVVPAPGAVLAVGLAGLAAGRRRR